MGNNIPEYVLGIDIGGTNTVFALVNTSGNIEYFNNCATSKFKTPTDLLKHIKRRIKSEAPDYKFTTLGIGAPNGSSVSGNIENAPNLKWKGIIPITNEAKKIFKTDVVVTNDANAAGLGECAWGKLRGMNDVIMLTIGTGLGCSIISSGRLIEGHQGFAGEFGHITVVQDGRKCKCGKKGCIEQYVSASGIKSSYIEFGGNETISVKEIFELSERNEIAQKTIKFTSELLGLHLANLINITNPQAVCIAGGIAESGFYMEPYLFPSIEKNILPMHRGNVEVFFSTLENQTAGVLGAAYLAFDQIINKDVDIY